VHRKDQWALTWINSANFAERLVAFAAVEGIFFSGSLYSILGLNDARPDLLEQADFVRRGYAMRFRLLYSYLQNKLPEERVQAILYAAVTIKQEFVTDALPVSLIGMNWRTMNKYINFIADRLLVSLGYRKIYNSPNPFDFMEMISVQGKTNFFERRVGDYQKAGVMSTRADNTFSLKAAF
jgi:ribonucleoside-diphosphate reductase beta chain